eukprot:PhM_4_TR8901/c0_g1_i1/m.71738
MAYQFSHTIYLILHWLVTFFAFAVPVGLGICLYAHITVFVPTSSDSSSSSILPPHNIATAVIISSLLLTWFWKSYGDLVITTVGASRDGVVVMERDDASSSSALLPRTPRCVALMGMLVVDLVLVAVVCPTVVAVALCARDGGALRVARLVYLLVAMGVALAVLGLLVRSLARRHQILNGPDNENNNNNDGEEQEERTPLIASTGNSCAVFILYVLMFCPKRLLELVRRPRPRNHPRNRAAAATRADDNCIITFADCSLVWFIITSGAVLPGLVLAVMSSSSASVDATGKSSSPTSVSWAPSLGALLFCLYCVPLQASVVTYLRKLDMGDDDDDDNENERDGGAKTDKLFLSWYAFGRAVVFVFIAWLFSVTLSKNNNNNNNRLATVVATSAATFLGFGVVFFTVIMCARGEQRRYCAHAAAHRHIFSILLSSCCGVLAFALTCVMTLLVTGGHNDDDNNNSSGEAFWLRYRSQAPWVVLCLQAFVVVSGMIWMSMK